MHIEHLFCAKMTFYHVCQTFLQLVTCCSWCWLRIM